MSWRIKITLDRIGAPDSAWVTPKTYPFTGKRQVADASFLVSRRSDPATGSPGSEVSGKPGTNFAYTARQLA